MISNTTPRGQTPVWPLNPCSMHSAEAVGDASWGPILLFVRLYLSVEGQSGQRISSHSLMPDGNFSLRGVAEKGGDQGGLQQNRFPKDRPPWGRENLATLPGDPALPTLL